MEPSKLLIAHARRKRRALERTGSQSANSRLPVKMRMIAGKMANQLTMLLNTVLLQVIGKENISLQDKQREVLRILAVEKDALAVLPTAYGKSLIYQALAPLMDYIVAGGHPTENKSVVLVVSPINALIKDQVTKLRQRGLRDRVDAEEVFFSNTIEPLESLWRYQLVFAHSEVLVDNKMIVTKVTSVRKTLE